MRPLAVDVALSSRISMTLSVVQVVKSESSASEDYVVRRDPTEYSEL